MKNKTGFAQNFRYDFAASITVFFVALPLCLGISLASGAPVSSGLIAGIIGGVVISLFSKSQLSVSGPAAGLTAICAAAIMGFPSLGYFFAAVALAGLMQILLGALKLGGFTQFIPSAVIRGMLAAIGIILIVKQIPLVVGYNQPDFWAKEIVNLFTFRHGFENISNLSQKLSLGTMLVSIGVVPVFFTWQRYGAKRFSFLPVSFMVVLVGVALAAGYNYLFAANPLTTDHYVSMPSNLFSGFMLPDWQLVIGNAAVWRTAVLICFVASLETLLSVEAIDKLDPYNRITPANRELVAQGIGNFASGLLGGLPITAVIVRSSANAQAGGRTRMSAFLHGIWLLIAVLFGAVIITVIPYCVLAVILIRTGYNLASPKMVRAVYKQGKEQFLPFLVTVVAVLFTDLLIGVLIGIVFAVYYLVVHTYRAGYTLVLEQRNGNAFYSIELALNVSFLNKKRIAEMLDTLPENAEVHINGAKSVYIDHDILEIFQDFKAKAKFKNILVATSNIPEVDTLEIH